MLYSCLSQALVVLYCTVQTQTHSCYPPGIFSFQMNILLWNTNYLMYVHMRLFLSPWYPWSSFEAQPRLFNFNFSVYNISCTLMILWWFTPIVIPSYYIFISSTCFMFFHLFLLHISQPSILSPDFGYEISGSYSVTLCDILGSPPSLSMVY